MTHGLIDKKDHVTYLGSFAQNTECMIVSDPAIETDLEVRVKQSRSFGSPILENVKPGIYHSWNIKSELTYKSEGRIFNQSDITLLLAIHQEYINSNLKWIKIMSVPVDSSQAGIYDCNYFNPQNSEWYEMNTKISLSPVEGGVMPNGVVSSAGGGDGFYQAYASYHEGRVIAIYIDFMS